MAGIVRLGYSTSDLCSYVQIILGAECKKIIPLLDELEIIDKMGLAHILKGSGTLFIRPTTMKEI
jgi:hypothetical protein